jgi:uncharacterized protein YicC (UPF0701 family)
MSNLDKNMSEIFDITPIEKQEKLPATIQKIPSENPNLDQDLNDAYQQSKENLQEIIDQGKEAMEDMLQIARASEHPRAFEVYSTILKNVVDANKELINMQKQMREMNGKRETNTTSIDKAIFVGSTAELSKLLKGKE